MFPRWLILGLILFLASAALAAGVAPQPAVAWPRFAELAFAAGLAVAIAALPDRWSRHAVTLTPLLAVPFILTGGDGLPGPYWSRNTVGGVAALVLPFAIAAVARPVGRLWRWMAGATALILLLILARSGSRGALIGMLAAVAVVALWWVSRRWGRRRLALFGAALGALTFLSIVVLSAAWPQIAPMINSVDAGGSDMGRLSIWRETLYLIGQAPITGWGPGAFEGAFALYARLIRVPLYSYAHQLYLGLAFEQGLGGLAVWVGLQAAAAISLLRADGSAGKGASDPYRLAALASTVTLAVHGLVDDPVYAAGSAVPFLFLWAGFAALLSATPRREGSATRVRAGRPVYALWIIGGCVALALGWLVRAPIQAAWYTNHAVLNLSTQELAAWPTAILPVAAPEEAREALSAALGLSPDQAAGRFRRGLLELDFGQYQAARDDLERVYRATPDSRAVVKALGYARLWSGDVEGALVLLRALPEVPVELDAYSGFWESQGQDALSQLARRLRSQLAP